MNAETALVALGPPQHGVRMHAQALIDATVGVTSLTGTFRELRPQLEEPGCPVHLHVADRVFGGSSTEAADAIERIAAVRPVSVTLHDIPQASDGAPWATRRASYARICAAAKAIHVSSEWERELLRAVDSDAAERATVIPLPIDPPASAPAPAESDSSVAVLGFIYPGKGHEQVLEAMAGIGPDVELVALGEASQGHDDLIKRVELAAAAQQRRFRLTGFLPDDELTTAARSVAVPVVAPTHVSASGSIGRWISAGRRPIVVDHPYFTELADRAPWALTLTHDLPSAIRAALENPASTWIDPAAWDAEALPGTAECARRQWAALSANAEARSAS